MSNDRIHWLEIFVHDNEAEDFTWVDLGSLLVDKKPKLVCLLEHIVLRLSLDQESTPAAKCTAVCSSIEGMWRGAAEGWRAVSPRAAAALRVVHRAAARYCFVHRSTGRFVTCCLDVQCPPSKAI